MEFAAIALGEKFQTNILLKGGHLIGNNSPDVLYTYIDKNVIGMIHQESKVKTLTAQVVLFPLQSLLI